MLLDGTEGQQMLDNMTVTKDGKILLQEDVGNNAHLGQDLAVRPGDRHADACWRSTIRTGSIRTRRAASRS